MIVYPPVVMASCETTRCRKKNPRFMKKMTNVKTPKRQVVQWKQTDVEQGVVVVDEGQLTRLIKTEPIEKYYQLDPEPFATGLFANVTRCKSLESGEVFAAKFSSRTRYGEDCTEELHHEIALLSFCSPSPRIVRLHDVFQTPKEIIIVMEFAPGGDMQTIIDDNLVPFESDVVKFIQHVVEGLAYLHQRKIAHLDIKPQNLVMMGDFPDCNVKVCDFEISRVILEGTEIREILGTPEYVAPEILHYEPITLAADMWSLGVTTYVLLTGFSPFGGETDQETFLNISQAQLDFPAELFEDISEDAKDFIGKLLVRDPKLRLTAKECLRHRWLASKRKQNNTNSNKTVSQGKVETTTVPEPGRRVGCASCSHSNHQKNLRKYLSKSREALFEKVVSRSQESQKNEQSLRKATLLSQYNKTRRLCESQMSLVSKSRERLLLSEKQSMMTPTFNRSREKLYGLRSLSKSHEVLNLCKTVGGLTPDLDIPETSPLKGILKNLSRTKDIDLQNDSQKDVKLENSTQSEEVKEITAESESKLDISSLPECQSLHTVLSFLCNQSNTNESKEVDDNKENINQKNSITDSTNTQEVENKTIEGVVSRNKIRPTLFLTKQNSVISTEGDPQSPAISHTDSLSLTDINSSSGSDISDEDGGSIERIIGEFSTEEDEPRFTVKQLVSAYNLHQEIVTKCSLEVTMNADSLETKIPPVMDKAPNHKFPTGPNALRLFIPGIDIESRSKRIKKKTKIVEQENEIIEIVNDKQLPCSESSDHTSKEKPFLEEEKTEIEKRLCDKEKQSVEDPKNYLRSSSISSETSCKSSGASSAVTASLEDIPLTDKKSRSNRSSGIASNDGDNSLESWNSKGSNNISKTIEKFNNGPPRPIRKSFCSQQPPVIAREKTRRKSNPIMKPFY
uniref:Protein kinase domain-containing protein n=1 Tax=Clastoptera arizonana TaxID=38151 RepID=A0A1B6CVK4_9HEMI